MSKYDPESKASRQELATALMAMLSNSGFVECTRKGTQERIFMRPVEKDTRMSVVVYTTIKGDAVRASGLDAIRVVVLFAGTRPTPAPLGSMMRVNRVGEVERIVERTLERMRSAYRLALKTPTCSCGAPKAKSKKGNLYCANLCWKH